MLVAEVTQPSLGVGYEIGRAFDMNKKMLCLYRPQPGKRVTKYFTIARLFPSVNYPLGYMTITVTVPTYNLYFPGAGLSAMIRGIHNGSSVTVRDYDESEVESILQTFFSSS